jgi:hypothetical protein
MLLADVVRASNQVSRTGSRNSKVSLLSDVLRRCALEVADGTAPADEIGLATRYLSGSLRQRRPGIELSSLPERSSWSELPAPPDTHVVTLSELDAVMQEASEMAGAGSSRLRADLFLDLVRKLIAEERTFVVGLLRGGLRQSALEYVAEALAKTGPAGVEWKLDGIRAQIHKQGNDIRALIRSLDDITDRVPEVVDMIRSLPVAGAIFDGELIALHPDGRPKPFQETGSRTAGRVDTEVARPHQW